MISGAAAASLPRPPPAVSCAAEFKYGKGYVLHTIELLAGINRARSFHVRELKRTLRFSLVLESS